MDAQHRSRACPTSARKIAEIGNSRFRLLGAILRDASLRDAHQDEVRISSRPPDWHKTMEPPDMTPALKLGAALALVLLSVASALPRSLQAIADRGTLTLCANPDALPWASKTGPVPGFQVELAEDLAKRLGVSLTRQWVISVFQYRRVDCDLVFDAIASKGASVEGGLRLSRPYQRSGVVLALRGESSVASLDGLAAGHRVGVLVGSLVSMQLDKRGIATTPFVLERELMAALAGGEVEAAALTPVAIGWYNRGHPQAPFRMIAAFASDPDLNWNLAVGMIGPDDKLRQQIDAALGEMLADGTIARIYAGYGIELRPPE
jgi:polar amino acid transport system substrate-binding protein